MPSRHSDIVVRPRLLSFLLTAALAFVTGPGLATPAAAATQVCVLACDTLDPSQARQESFPAPTWTSTAVASNCMCPTRTTWPGPASTTA